MACRARPRCQNGLAHVGRLEDIVDRNQNPRKHRHGRFPMGIAISAFVLLILVLMIFTDLGKPPTKPPPPPEEGRVRDIGIYVDKRVPRDAAVGD
jgi:hypothetical protein